MKQLISKVLNHKHFQTFENSISVVLCVYLYIELGAKGILYWVLAVLLIAGIRLYRFRDSIIPMYLDTCRYGATILRGMKDGKEQSKKDDGINPNRKGKGDNAGSCAKQSACTSKGTTKDAQGLQQDMQQVQKEDD